MKLSNEKQALDFLEPLGQEHVLRFFPRLDKEQKRRLLQQISNINPDHLRKMQAMLARGDKEKTDAGAIKPAPVEDVLSLPAETGDLGQAALDQGRVGVILVAGGQGSRLGFDGPKGCLPIGPVSDAPLFAIHARKVLALARRHGKPVPLYIMTSEANDEQTRRFFDLHGFFGLDPEHVKFFVQGMWPALDQRGKLLLERPERIFMSPDGHGGTLAALKNSGMLEDMARRELETLFYCQVDNPLAQIADPVFIGLHKLRQADMSLKVCAKRDPEEGLGLIALRDNRPCIVEYSEIGARQREARDRKGDLLFRYGSVAIHLFSRKFLAASAERELPLHLACKKVPFCDDNGRIVCPEQPNAWKFEKFIFDILPFARHSLNFVFDRKEEFSPVKNRTGEDSPETCKRDISAKFARWLVHYGAKIALDGQGRPRHPIEIDPVYADSLAALNDRIKPGLRLCGPILLEA